METFMCHKSCCTLKIKPYVEQKLTYEKFHGKRKKSGVFICDPKTNKVLIIQSRGHLWGPPKGTTEEGETEIQCAIREVKEETGLEISENCLSEPIAIYNKATYFYLEMNECELNVQDNDPTNDANGIGWIKIECLEKCIEKGNISISKHFRMLFRQLQGVVFPRSDFILVNKKKRSRKIHNYLAPENLTVPLDPYSGYPCHSDQSETVDNPVSLKKLGREATELEFSPKTPGISLPS
jgi:ADP-ribose pyrophosphatase YjhB (NUDIX family)